MQISHGAARNPNVYRNDRSIHDVIAAVQYRQGSVSRSSPLYETVGTSHAQSTERKKGDGEEKSHRLGATERPARHFVTSGPAISNYSTATGSGSAGEANDIWRWPNTVPMITTRRTTQKGGERRPSPCAAKAWIIVMSGERRGYWLDLPLLVAVRLAPLFFRSWSPGFDFFGSSASAFCQDSRLRNAIQFEIGVANVLKMTGSSWSAVFAQEQLLQS